MSVRYRYVRNSRMYRLVPRLEVEGGWFYESNERGKEIEIDDSFFPLPTQVLSRSHARLTIISRQVFEWFNEESRSSNDPLFPSPLLDRVGYLFIATIDSLFPPLFLVFSLEFLEASWESVGILLFLDSYLRSYRIRSNRREESNRDEGDTQWYGFFFEFVYKIVRVVLFFFSLSPSRLWQFN